MFWLISLFCLVAVLLPALFLTSSGSAQRTRGGVPPPAKGRAPVMARPARNAALTEATEEVLKETSEIRELSILRPVPSSTQSRAEIEHTIVKNLNEEVTPAQTHATEVTMKRLGLAPPDFEYRPFMVKLLTEQVAGYYDPKTRQFYLADWIELDGQRPIMAHELTHALQDQHFNLRRFDNWPKGDSDAELAAHALIEGDATLAMMLYVANSPMRAVAFLKSMTATGMASEELDKAPRALRDTLMFPYAEGTDWARNVYKQGGWEQVSRAFTNLPQSTEQVMHPEKYFAHEAPVKVTLPDVSALLNASDAKVSSERGEVGSGQWAVGSRTQAAHRLDSSRIAHHASLRANEGSFVGGLLPTAHRPLPTGTWRRIDSDVEGEWGMFLLLDQFLRFQPESRRAAAGWAGDRYAIYENTKGDTCLVSLSVWDTDRDAREFFDAYVKRTGLRYSDAVRLDSPNAEDETRGPNPEPRSRSAQSFRTSEGLIVIQRVGARVVILEGLPESANVAALMRLLSP